MVACMSSHDLLPAIINTEHVAPERIHAQFQRSIDRHLADDFLAKRLDVTRWFRLHEGLERFARHAGICLHDDVREQRSNNGDGTAQYDVYFLVCADCGEELGEAG